MPKTSEFSIIILLVLVFVGGFIFANSKLSHSNNTSQSTDPPAGTIIPTNTQSARANLQIGTFGFVTGTPIPENLTTTKSPAVGTKTGIDFSSASLDWDDVAGAIDTCKTLSSACNTELNAAVDNEEGGRVPLCSQDIACETHGYDHYTGNTPLPVYIPSAACQVEFDDCFQKAIQSGFSIQIEPGMEWTAAEIKQELIPSVFPNCDISDTICGSYVGKGNTIRWYGSDYGPGINSNPNRDR